MKTCSGRVKTKWGTFNLETNDKGVYAVDFPKHQKSSTKTSTPTKEFNEAKKLLVQYFDGKKVDLTRLKVDLEGYTSFERKVYQQLKKVKRGKVTTYGELAKKAGFPGAARAVGSTMNKNRIPLILPCHRVVGSSGKLTGFAAGLSWKKRLLQLEEAL